MQRLSLFKPRSKRGISSETLLLLVMLLLVGLANAPFWSNLLAARDWHEAASWRLMASSFVALTAWQYALVAIIAVGPLLRPLLGGLILLSLFCSYYMLHYGIVIDPSMLRNVLQTDWHEAHELLHPGLLGWLALGLLPLLFVWRVPLQTRPWRLAFLARSLSLLGAILLGVCATWLSYQDLSALLREHKTMRYQLVPGNVLWSLSRVVIKEAQAQNTPPRLDPVTARAMTPAHKPRLLVMVVGETVRAANFGLNGYERMTTPELAGLATEIVNFTHASACGTSTAVSVPCMFSRYGRDDYDEMAIRHQESLLQLAARAGVAVTWLDNQSGCKGVCAGLEFVDLAGTQRPAHCNPCHDEVLLEALQHSLAANTTDQDRLIVLHQLGNHGPAYYQRYPASFEKYTPACQDNDLGRCSRTEIINAYDNAVSYTDHLLAQAMRMLGAWQTRYDGALLYVSDHGESLGEHGLYLHGLPYAIAPREQLQVPLLWWLPEDTAAALNILRACLQDKARQPVSHDIIYSSVLGYLGLNTASYRVARDIFADCRG